MSRSAEVDKDEECEFNWGKKRGVGGKRKEVQFYESFTYDGVEYTLHDCVYLYKEGEDEPYIGKLIKIWEHPDKSKKIKVLWFFRPREILKWLGDSETLEKELFLASGEGVGLANVNPLEAISGKCNVVCISKDSRNPQPSNEEIQMADHVFYRTFNVADCTILDKIDEKIAGVEAKFIFNRRVDQKPSENPNKVLEMDYGRKDVGNAVASSETLQLSEQKSSEEDKAVKIDGNARDALADENAEDKAVEIDGSSKVALTNENAEAKAVKIDRSSSDVLADKNAEKEAVKIDGSSRDGLANENADVKVSLVKQRSSLGEKHASEAEIVLVNNATVSTEPENVLDDRTRLKSKIDSEKYKGNSGEVLVNQVKIEEKVKSTRDSSLLDGRPSKKAKVNNSGKLSEDKSQYSLPKLSSGSDGKARKASESTTNTEYKTKPEIVKDSHGLDKGPSKKLKPDESRSKLSNGKLIKSYAKLSPDKAIKTEGQIMEVTRRPDADRSRWFKGLPWDDRLQTAHKQGTLVLLQNLDPAFTSAEVEDIVWHGFKESCTAKMIQRTAISSPHSGQAFVIFKTKEAANMAVRKLEEGCFLLSNGRPLVGSFGTPCFAGKQSTFAGHFCIDKLKHQLQREMKQAVSTSHCSQPNTIEYEMAMDWCLVQERSDGSWKKLHKKQGEELTKLKASFKSK